MCLNEMESLEDNNRSDSFSERVCDDLCQSLQYFSLGERLKILFKQFLRNILKKEKVLIMRTVDHS